MDSKTLFQHEGQWLPAVYECDLSQTWFLSDRYYPVYFDVFCDLLRKRWANPVRLFEFGVRSGYIPIVFKRAIDALGLGGEYVGIDLDDVFPEGLARCRASLEMLGLPHQLIRGDVKTHDLSAYRDYHLIHVDSEHTYEGKLSDLDNASRMLAAGGSILVDDYAYDHVRKPVDDWLTLHPDMFTSRFVETCQGLLILGRVVTPAG